jgi:hypothetical protein
LLFEEIGPVELGVDRRDPGELGLLALGQVLGVLPQGVARSLQIVGVGLHPGPARLVPHLAAHPVEGVGGPLHDVESVHAQRGVLGPLTDHVGDPLGPSALTRVIFWHRSSPIRSKNELSVFLFAPTAA